MRPIDADALLSDIERTIEESGCVNHEGEIMDCIRYASEVDAVPVVRCKDCKHNGTWQCHMEYDEYHPEADIHHEMHGDDDFCSYGERKEDET